MSRCFAGESPAYFRAFHNLFPEKRPQIALLAHVGGTLAGYLEGHWRSHYFGDREIATANIGAVCVDPDFRRRGVASALLTNALARIDPGRFPLTGLHAAVPALYEQFGFLPVNSTHWRVAVPEQLPPSPRGIPIAPVTAGDHDELFGLYQRENRQLIGPLVRSRRYFVGQHDWMRQVGGQLHWEALRVIGNPVGYLRARVGESQLNVLEVIASGRARSRAAAGRLLSLARAAGAATITGGIHPRAPVVSAMRELTDVELVEEPGLMFKINSLDGLLAAIQPQLAARRRSLAIFSAPAINLRIGEELVGLEFPPAAVRFGHPIADRPTIAMSKGEFLGLVFGCPGSLDVLDMSGLRADSQAQFEAAFPETGWVLWGADHY